MKKVILVLVLFASHNQLTMTPENHTLSKEETAYFDSILIFSGLNPNQKTEIEPQDQPHSNLTTSKHYAESTSGLHHFKKKQSKDS